MLVAAIAVCEEASTGGRDYMPEVLHDASGVGDG